MQRYLIGLLVCASSIVGSAQQSYSIGPQDVLDITVWEQPDLSGKYTVAADGSFTFPLIGRVKAAGLSAYELESALKSSLQGRFLRNPQVVVAVAEYLSQRIYVIGEVKTPGPVPLTSSLTLMEALSRAGSLSEQAGGELSVIRPSGDAKSAPTLPGQEGATEILRASVQEVRAGTLSQNLTLRHGDTVFVPRAEMIYVIGQVNKPGAYTLEQNMTVLRAISSAGGITRLGSSGRIVITRFVNGKETEIKANLNDLVKGGDNIEVPTRRF
jgi:polysaccharide export outer membrane protein